MFSEQSEVKTQQETKSKDCGFLRFANLWLCRYQSLKLTLPFPMAKVRNNNHNNLWRNIAVFVQHFPFLKEEYPLHSPVTGISFPIMPKFSWDNLPIFKPHLDYRDDLSARWASESPAPSPLPAARAGSNSVHRVSAHQRPCTRNQVILHQMNPFTTWINALLLGVMLEFTIN